MLKQTEMQIGKNGITQGFIETMKKRFKDYKMIRVSILKSAGKERNNIKETSEKILDGLGKNFTSKIIGFTLIVQRWNRDMR